MSLQRKRGPLVTFWRTEDTTDARGQQVKQATPVDPVVVRGSVTPLPSNRGSRRLLVLVDGLPDDVTAFSRAEYDGTGWDLTGSPQRVGTGRQAHTRVELVERRPFD